MSCTESSTVALSYVTVLRSTAAHDGGALYVAGSKGATDAGMHAAYSNLTLSAVRLTGAKATYKGGALFAGENSRVVVHGALIDKASASVGGGLYVEGEHTHVQLVNVSFVNCAAEAGDSRDIKRR